MDFTTFDISASALSAQKVRMDVIAANLANINTTRTREGGPYRRQDVIFKSVAKGNFSNHLNSAMGVDVVKITRDQGPAKMVNDPSHPDADKNGYVAMPNISLMSEMANMMLATRSYEANAEAISSAKSMYLRALDIGR